VTVFDNSLALARGEDGAWHGETSPAYANMVGPFGGWIAAICMKAVLSEESRLGDPIALTLNFMGPIADGAFRITTRLSRRNRSTEFWLVELVQGEGDGLLTAIQAMITLGAHRDTQNYSEISMPDVAGPESAIRAPLREGGPKWFAQFDNRWLSGLPFQGGVQGRSRQWARLAEPRPLDAVLLTAIADLMPPRTFFHFATMTPSSTISMSVYFHATPDEMAEIGDQHVLIDSAGRYGARGFCDHEARVWAPDGRLLATTEQVVWFK
jgi:hypothetical protein